MRKMQKKKVKDLLKIAVKVKMALTEGKLKPEDGQHAVKPLMDLAKQILAYFSPIENTTADEDKKATELLVESINKAHKITADLMKPHMKEKNQAKLDDLYATMGNSAFLLRVRKEKEYDEEKKDIFHSLQMILERTAEESGMVEASALPCLTQSCSQRRVGPLGKFPGSDYCVLHHQYRYAGELESPILFNWLNQEDLLKVLNPFLTKKEPESVAFVRACDQYFQISRKEMRAPRATNIYSKFVESKTVTLEPKTVSDIADAMKLIEAGEGKHEASKELFRKAQKEVQARLQAIFDKEFLQTDEYKQWVTDHILPPEVLRYAKDKTRIQEKIIAAKAAAAADEQAEANSPGDKDKDESKGAKS